MIDGEGLFGFGTSAGGYTRCHAPAYNTGVVLSGGAVLLEFDHGLQSLSTAIEEYAEQIGLGDSVNASEHVDGVYFEYDRAGSTGGADIWKICAAANSTRTKTETAIAPTLYTNAMQRMAIIVNSGATRCDFWINEVKVGTVTTNIPSGLARSTTINFGGTKTVGSTQRYAGLGYCKFVKSYTARR
jgi:hypothetical protein